MKRVPADLRDGAHGGLVSGDAACQLVDPQGGQLPSLGLADVEHGEAEACEPAPGSSPAPPSRFAMSSPSPFALTTTWLRSYMTCSPFLTCLGLVLPGPIARYQRRVWGCIAMSRQLLAL